MTRLDRIKPCVRLHATFLLLLVHPTLALSFSASFLCSVLPMRSPSSVSLMGRVNVGARAAHINCTRSLFTFLLPSPLASLLPPCHLFHSLESSLCPLTLQEPETDAVVTTDLPRCQSSCCLALTLCSSGWLCFSPEGCNNPKSLSSP